MMYNPNDNTTFKINRHKTPEELEKKNKTNSRNDSHTRGRKTIGRRY